MPTGSPATVPPTATDPRQPCILLVDDQPIIGEAVRRMLVGEDDLGYHYCRDSSVALATAADVGPTVILLDLVMPGIDGLELVRRFRADGRFADVPIIVLSTKEEAAVKAEAFQLGANDYIVKLPDRLELLARVRHHSRGYIALLERNQAFEALRASREALAEDLASAARYVRSLLPPPQRLGGATVDWRFVPSAELGGDAFGFHRIDDHRTAVYLLDVCGHGVGAALLSVSVLTTLRTEALPHTDFLDPGTVLAALNRAFPMERQNDMFFTIWYGILDSAAGRLRWSGGGHPPALLIPPLVGVQHPAHVLLDSDGPLIGAVDGLEFQSREISVDPGSHLYLYSDGAFEVSRPDGSMWGFASFLDVMTSPTTPPERRLDTLRAAITEVTGRDDFADDFSIVAVGMDEKADSRR
ncbi:MAG: SpoIIE family protein phosphatase [Planctomycetes bacterium]|nr:SpoIIE family protein phosphatase [Planctomycetota bacterium]